MVGIYWNKDIKTYSAYVQTFVALGKTHYYTGLFYMVYKTDFEFNPAARFKLVAPKGLAEW